MKLFLICGHMPGITLRLFHSKKKLRRALRHLGMGDDLNDTGNAVVYYKPGGKTFLVYIEKESLHKDATQDIGLLAHEATHVAQGYFAAIGENEPSDELYAYTVGAVTQYLCKEHFAWKKRRIKKKRS